MADDLYDIHKYTDQQLYDILDMNSPTDRELEAKIIHLINKYENMQNASGDQLALFFQNIYNHFFNTGIEGFTNPTPDPIKTMDPSKFALSDDESSGNKVENITLQPPPSTTVKDGEISTKKVGYEPQPISNVQQFDYSSDKLQLNPLLKQTIKRIISIDSQYRDIRTNPMTTNFSFDLSEPLRDVVSLKLYSVQIPYTWYTIPKSYGSNFFYLKGNVPGITDGHHDYKIGIPVGNYTPTELQTTINDRFNNILTNPPGKILTDIPGVISASDVSFNTAQLITYNANTSKMTMNIDLQKTYSEAYYQLYFPQWTSPITDSSSSIPGYMGFNNQSYDPCAITSKQNYITTSTLIAETTANYSIDNTNNFFTLKIYSNDNYKFTYDPTTIPIYTFTVQLKSPDDTTTNFVSTSVTRDNIITSLITALQTNEFLDPVSTIQRIDIPTNKANAGYSYYKLTLIIDRYYKKYIPNAKIVIAFPAEEIKILGNGKKSTIWTYQNNTDNSCFFFDTYINTLSQFISESSAVFSSYKVDTSSNILFTCNTTGYTGGANDFSLNIPTNMTPGYTLNNYLNVITQTFATYSINNTNFNMISAPGDVPKGAYLDASSKFNLTIDLTKIFTTAQYDISINTVSLLYNMGQYNVGSNWTENAHLVDKNIFSHSIKNSSAGYFVDASYILTISPNTIIQNPGNRNAPPLHVFLLPQYGIPLTFDYVEDYISAIQTSIQQSIVVLPNINDIQRPLSQSSFTGTLNAQTKNYDLSLNIVYSYSLTESNYDISFIDHTYDIGSQSNSWHYFDIYSNYNLFTNNAGSYAKLTGKTAISGDQINIVNGSNTILLQTNNLSQYNIPSDQITLTIDPGAYTINMLYNKIQSLFDANPKLYGSTITSIPANNKIYTQIKMNINNVYTSKDYKLVFYDPFSFVKCFSGSKSVQNTTWDSTLGWILGFRDYTEYSLVQTNQVSDGNGGYYYITSSNGTYTYDIQANTTSQIVTNIIIHLTGDTTVSTNLYNYFLISLDDYIQNHLNDGLVTITRKETAIAVPEYSYATTRICDPVTNTLVNSSSQQSNSDNVTNKQLYSLNQSIYSEKNAVKTYSPGPFIKDLFGFIPIKPPSKNGDYYIEFGGSLQNQERLYFGPVNIRKMTIQLLNDRGDTIDLNNSNWSFSFVCEQLYRATSS